MAVYVTNTSELTSIADAIRTKGGTSTSLEYPQGFISAINSISSGQSINLQAKTNITPTTASQTIYPDTGYNGLSSVQINAMPSGTQGTPIATKGTVSNNSVSITPSVTNTAGYIAGGTNTGTAVTVSASELVSGNKEINSNGTGIDVTNYSTVSVAVPSATLQAKTNIAPTTSSQTITPDSGYDGLSSVQINAMPAGTVTAPSSISGTSATVSTGTGTLTLTKTVSVTPSVTTAGYVTTGTAGNASVSLTASVNIRSSSDLTASGATVTVPAGYYASQATKSVTTMTLPTSASSSATSGYTSKATISRSTSNQYINIPPGYNSAGGYYTISAVANGSATGPSSLSGTSATVSTGTNTITLTKTGVSTTPTVSAGYVSSATSSSATVTLTASVTTKAAATITPGTSNQTIAAGTYLTGAQTISGDADLVASNIISTANIFGVQGSVVIQHYYTGTGTPSNSTGADGDIYLKTT